ncbi:hypothetical protein SK069_03425 [Patulibacter brassicae]|jgi:hypothetical protein|uniref:Htaa domain-containing protein n=1 Tax=Patulibacter brassicae TaxID=1705717 RepID=A0ABU4VI93_9ACTN|nr:HtaA domain-containing protein [Patulibacter brassicae]MDX8150633.1 hypothetical protein [Patulibacter brassicae]
MSKKLRLPVAGVAAVTALALVPAATQAATVTAGGGTTTVRLTSATAKGLASLGVQASAISPAKASSAGVAFPITGGRIDDRTGAGSLEHSGGLRLRKGSAQIALRDFRLKVGKRSTLSARVGKARVTVFRLSTSRARISRSGLQTRVSRVRVQLSSVGAAALNRTFHVHAFRAGQTIATATAAVTPRTIALRGRDTALTLDPSTAAALGVQVAPAGAARLDGGAVRFPISGGSVNAATLAGRIDHRGGLRLSADSTAVTLDQPRISLGTTNVLSAVIGATRTTIADLDLGAAKTSSSGRRITVSGVAVRLNATAASALNSAFGTTALTPGTPLGTATVTAEAR